MRRTWMSCALLSLSLACGPDGRDDEPEQSATLDREALMNPQTCQGCHPRHYREWASSMHAYAADDPVFRAMNQRGQRETQGELGDFCVRCHAPLAVSEGKTKDGTNLSELPQHLRGVTCYACHTAVDIEGDHNGKLVLAGDSTMRAGIEDPVHPGVHGVAYSPMHDRNRPESSRFCGGCHDVVNAQGVHVERTYLEYEESLLSKAGPAFDTCQGCHMDARKGPAAVDPEHELPERTLHEHLWPGVDVALTDFPDRELQRRAVECALANGTRIAELRATPLGEFTVTLETNAGHAQPSGAGQHRRMWLELVAYDAQGKVLYQSGLVDDREALDESDPALWLMRDHLYDAQGKPVHMMWEAAASELHTTGYETLALPALEVLGQPHTLSRTYQTNVLPERVTVRLRMRPVGLEVLEDLVASGDLDARVLDEMPTFTLYGSALEWNKSDGFAPLTQPDASPLRCPEDYLCMLDPDAEQCRAP